MKRSCGRTSPSAGSGFVLITGGAGFIGTNLAQRLLADGRKVRIYDNLSRAGVMKNLDWLCNRFNTELLDIRVEDVRDPRALEIALNGVEQVFHLAAQVAVTTSIGQPLEDFEVNVRGTLNLLEAMRRMPQPPDLVFTSTNKVYGNLLDFPLRRNGTRYEPANGRSRQWGISESQSMQFSSPYGCSKGAADQYVLDYAHTYKLPAVVMRMSCIYGPHQMGTEDQGWVAHFLIRSQHGSPITVFGDGLQVRDVLYVDDLVNAMMSARHHISRLSGRPFNIGGGPGNTLSLMELLQMIEDLQGKLPEIHYADWRQGDQRYFVADYRSYKRATGWSPQVDVHTGIRKLHQWLEQNGPAPDPRLLAAGQEL
jgi:CDP-paratose 2-epimerase